MEPLRPEEVIVLSQGKTGEFWRILCRELEWRVKKLTDDVMDENIDLEEEKRKKYKASSYKSLMDLPDVLIRENETLPKTEKAGDPSVAY